jgi:hypothetical protein
MVRYLDSEGTIYGFEVVGKITDAEYEQLSEDLAEIVDEYERARLLVLFSEEFTMMDPVSFWEEVRLSLDHLDDVERLALVGHARWSHAYTQTLEPQLPSIDMRAFALEDEDDAWQWLRID